MKFEGTASIIADRFASIVAVDSPELRGLRYQASRLLDDSADDQFEIKFADGEWKLEYLRNIAGANEKAASALVRYAEARRAAMEDAVSEFINDQISVSVAACLLDTVPDSVRARIADGSLEGHFEKGRAVTSFAALVRFVDQRVPSNRPRALHPAVDR